MCINKRSLSQLRNYTNLLTKLIDTALFCGSLLHNKIDN